MTLIIKTEKKQLPCPLKDVEIQMAGVELARAVEAVDVERAAQKEAKSEMKARMDELNQIVSVFARKVNRHEEDREVEVEFVLDPDSENITMVRTDTGEVIAQRRAEPDELQMTFDKQQEEDEPLSEE